MTDQEIPGARHQRVGRRAENRTRTSTTETLGKSRGSKPVTAKERKLRYARLIVVVAAFVFAGLGVGLFLTG